MKIGIARAALVTVLEQVCKVIPTSKSIPILTYVRIDAWDGNLRLTGTDLVTSITVALPATDPPSVAVGEPGSVLVDAHLFLGFLRGLPTRSLGLSTADHGLKAKFDNHTSLWKAPPVEQFPDVAVLEDKWTHRLPREHLIHALRLVKPAAAAGSFHPKLEQVGLRRGKVQAADGIRFHEVTLPETDLMDVALPLTFLDDVLRLLALSTSEHLDLGVPEDGRSLIVHLDTVTMTTAVRQETFPDVAHAFLIPAMANTTTLKVNRDHLMAALRRVRLMADPTTKAVKITLDGFDRLEVSARQPSGAWAQEQVGCVWTAGARTLTFNHEYLLHLLALFEREMLTLQLGPDARHKPSPLLIQEPDRAGVLAQLATEWAA